ncbi:MAG: hypothetical protein EB084_13280 [Proteobacteria bacterium]|nr:hypothetical protein [Pseudomonadota bacterium]
MASAESAVLDVLRPRSSDDTRGVARRERAKIGARLLEHVLQETGPAMNLRSEVRRRREMLDSPLPQER